MKGKTNNNSPCSKKVEMGMFPPAPAPPPTVDVDETLDQNKQLPKLELEVYFRDIQVWKLIASVINPCRNCYELHILNKVWSTETALAPRQVRVLDFLAGPSQAERFTWFLCSAPNASSFAF